MNKWLVLFCGIVLQAILGGIYAWSEFTRPLMESYGLSQIQCGSIFGFTVAAFTIAMIPAGKFMHHYGPRPTAMIGALLFSAGYLLASTSTGTYLALLLCFGLLIGPGIGFGYVCPLTVGMKWFPENRGLVTGIAVAGFGGGAVILSQLAQYLFYTGYGVLEIFRFIGFFLGGAALLAAAGLREPKPHGEDHVIKPGELFGHVFSWHFLLILFGMFSGTFSGLMVIGNLKPIMLKAGLTDSAATTTIALFAIGNVFGRIFWGRLHDHIGSRRTILLSSGLFALALAFLLVDGPHEIAVAATFFAGAGFGSCFVVFASTIVEKFGVKIFPRLYPICFLAYGFAALTGPAIGGIIADMTGSFKMALAISCGVIVFQLLVFAALFSDQSKAPVPLPEVLEAYID